MDRNEYKNKEKKYIILGAKQMEKIVLFLEKKKFKFIKKFIPNLYLSKGQEIIKHQKDKKLKKLEKLRKKDLENSIVTNRKYIEEKYNKEKELIIAQYKACILCFKKEYYDETNINYHIVSTDPLETKYYLEWNKSVHKHGLIKNGIVLPIVAAASISGFIPAIPFVINEIIEIIINLECINLQNYNINRLERIDKVLKKKSEQKIAKIEESTKKYGEVQNVIAKTLRNSDEISSIDTIIGNIQTKEQAEQLKELILNKLKSRKANIQEQNPVKKLVYKGE